MDYHHSVPFFSAIGIRTYKLVKLLVPILPDITQNEFAVQEFFTITDEILTQDSDLDMTSLDVESLFTNIPLDKAVNICVKELFGILDFWLIKYHKIIFVFY